MTLTLSFLVPGTVQEMIDYYQDVFGNADWWIRCGFPARMATKRW